MVTLYNRNKCTDATAGVRLPNFPFLFPTVGFRPYLDVETSGGRHRVIFVFSNTLNVLTSTTIVYTKENNNIFCHTGVDGEWGLVSAKRTNPLFMVDTDRHGQMYRFTENINNTGYRNSNKQYLDPC